MSEQIQVIVYSLLNLLSLYTLNSAISIFLKEKQNIKLVLKVIPYLIFIVIGVFTYYWSHILYLNTIVVVILVLIMTFNFDGSIKNKLAIALIWILFKFIIEFIISLVYIMVLDISLNEILTNELLKLTSSAYIVLTSVILIKLAQLIMKRITTMETISYIDSFKISIIPICSIIILYAFVEFSLLYNTTNFIIVISIILIVFINVFFFYLFDKLKEVEQLKFDNELHKNQSDYYVKIEESVNISFDRIRTIKHDLKNQLLYLKTRTKDNPVEALEEIDEKLDILIGETLNEEFIEYTKNTSLNRFLNYKVLQIKKKGIDFNIKTNVGEYSNIDARCMYVILGNAIDNAVYNYSDIKSTDKNINIKILEESDNLLIKISNPYTNKLVFRNGLPITSKGDTIMHGVGLKSIKKIIDEKNGYFKINTNNNIFSVEILLFDEIL